MLHMKILIGATRLANSAGAVVDKAVRTSVLGWLALLGLADPAAASTLDDGQILGIYIQVNGFDAETALLGRALANSSAVRKLAAHVSADHLGVRQAAYSIAAKCKVSPITPSERTTAAIEHGQEMSMLSALEGSAFDLAYLRHELAFHTSAIEAVRKALKPSATCPELRAHFEQVLPAFEHHLAETQALARELNIR